MYDMKGEGMRPFEEPVPGRCMCAECSQLFLVHWYAMFNFPISSNRVFCFCCRLGLSVCRWLAGLASTHYTDTLCLSVSIPTSLILKLGLYDLGKKFTLARSQLSSGEISRSEELLHVNRVLSSLN